MGSILVFLSVFFVTTSTTSDYKVFITKNKYEADLWVWSGKSRYECIGKEEFWFQTNSRSQSTFSVRWVKTKYQSDLVIFFVKNRHEAKWVKNHPLKNILIKPK